MGEVVEGIWLVGMSYGVLKVSIFSVLFFDILVKVVGLVICLVKISLGVFFVIILCRKFSFSFGVFRYSRVWLFGVSSVGSCCVSWV